MSDKKEYLLKLTEEELRLIQYWRESCHAYNDFCPLHCLETGTDFCYLVTEHIKSQYKEQSEGKKE